MKLRRANPTGYVYFVHYTAYTKAPERQVEGMCGVTLPAEIVSIEDVHHAARLIGQGGDLGDVIVRNFKLLRVVFEKAGG